jgi:hypothetical protein
VERGESRLVGVFEGSRSAWEAAEVEVRVGEEGRRCQRGKGEEGREAAQFSSSLLQSLLPALLDGLQLITRTLLLPRNEPVSSSSFSRRAR